MKKIFLFLSIIGLLSCDDFLDVAPKGQLIPTTMEDFELLLNAPSMMNASEYNVLQYYCDDAYWPDMLMMVMKQVPMLYKSYTWEKDIYAANEDDQMWTSSYSRIFTYNTVVGKIMDSKGGTTTQKESIRAEAMLGRSVDYFYLVNTYGPAYSEGTKDTPAVPLVLTDDAAQVLERNTIGEVYEQIVKDLKYAADYLPETPKLSIYRGSKAGAWGMLARIGLYTGDWEMAVEYANLALNKHNTLLNYNNYTVVDDRRDIGRTDLPRINNNPEVFYARQFSYQYSVSGLIWASPELEALYTTGDRRFTLYFSKYFSMMGSNLQWSNYAAFYELCITPAVPELLLTRAEAYARLGGGANREKALADLNRLRQNRFEPAYYQPLSSSDDSEVLRRVLDERRRELIYMGLRFYDQKRLNLEPAFASDRTRVVERVTLSMPINSPLYVMTIWPKIADYHPEWFE